MKTALLALVLAVVLFDAYVRLAPSDAVRWHVDPLTATSPGSRGVLILPEGGDLAAPVWAVDGTVLMAALDEAALAEPRVRRLAGEPGEGFVTYVARSRLWGFPDYVSVRAMDVPGGATLAIYSRSRFGSSDLGVNRARAERWIAAIDLPRAEPGPGT